MKARVAAPARGARWLAEGWRLFLAAPLGWLAITFGYLMLTMFLTVVPAIGFLLSLMAYPAFTVGFMTASRAAALRQPIELPMLFAGFRERLRSQVLLGAAYALGVVLAILASWLADDGVLLRFVFTPPPAQEGASVPPDIRSGALMALGLYVPTFLAMFFAPLLVAWHAMPPVKAMFYSFFACLLNWRAFVVYAASGLAVMFLLSNLLFMLIYALAGAEARENPAALLALLLPLMFMLVWPVVMASAYAGYRDVFGAPEGA